MRQPVFISLVVVLFLVARCTAASAAWKFAVISDSRGGMDMTTGSDHGVRVSVLAPIAESMAAEGVDMVLFPGDQVDGDPKYGTMKEQLFVWKKAMEPVYKAGIPVYAFRGNHETKQAGCLEDWDVVFLELPTNGPNGQKELTYSIDHKNARFVGFDQYVGRPSTFDEKQYDSRINYGMVHQWVIQQITSTPTPWVFVFGHEPAFIVHHANGLANAPAERDALWNALGSKNGVYFCGHDHLYLHHVAPDDKGNRVHELVVGCGGAPFYPFDNESMNKSLDHGICPTTCFVNAGSTTGVAANTNSCGYPPYFGYLVITVDGHAATAEWKAFINYDSEHWIAPEKPEFRALDTFIIETATSVR